MAKFFSHGGVKSICSSPTTTTGDPLAPVTPATNCPTPSPAAAASSPATAPRRSAPFSLILHIRRCGRGGLLRQSKPTRSLLRITIVMAMPGGESGPRPSPQDLAAQLALVARGDAAAFAAVYDQVAAGVFGIVRRVLRDLAQSEEV